MGYIPYPPWVEHPVAQRAPDGSLFFADLLSVHRVPGSGDLMASVVEMINGMRVQYQVKAGSLIVGSLEDDARPMSNSTNKNRRTVPET